MTVHICTIFDTAGDEGCSAYVNKKQLEKDILDDISEYVRIFLEQGCTEIEITRPDEWSWRVEGVDTEYFREWNTYECEIQGT